MTTVCRHCGTNGTHLDNCPSRRRELLGAGPGLMAPTCVKPVGNFDGAQNGGRFIVCGQPSAYWYDNGFVGRTNAPVWCAKHVEVDRIDNHLIRQPGGVLSGAGARWVPIAVEPEHVP